MDPVWSTQTTGSGSPSVGLGGGPSLLPGPGPVTTAGSPAGAPGSLGFVGGEMLNAAAAASSAAHNQKTPISVLQEVCSRKSLTPEYKLISVEGAVHAPTFFYRVEVGEVFATASGQSKKKAKHCAAKVLIEKIVEDDCGPLVFLKPLLLEGIVGMSDGLGSEKEGSSAAAALNTSGASDTVNGGGSDAGEDDGIPGNPVGQLQELCMKKRWRPPFYETQMEEGLPHERMFGIMCVVNTFTEIGFGKSKRLAKRQAAYKMIQLIEKLQTTGTTNGESGGLEVKFSELADEMRDLQIVKTEPIPTITAKHSQQVSNILKQLKSSNGPQLNDLQYKNLSTSGLNYTGLLREIADEQKFEVTYIPAETVEGRATCLCHLTTLPLAVCFGIGETEELAKMNASHNALQYLKIMTRKK